MIRTTYPDRESWLLGRKPGIGGSEAAAIVGMSPWMTASQLWQMKRGLWTPPDKTENEAVTRGVRLEPPIRQMYAALHPEIRLEYYPFDTLAQEERPWLFATLDGEIVYPEEQREVLEIKSAALNSRAAMEKWEGRVPDAYYIQVLHQMLATGYRGAVLAAALIKWDGEILFREYRFDREECREDMEWLLLREEAFYQDLQAGRMPKVYLNI